MSENHIAPPSVGRFMDALEQWTGVEATLTREGSSWKVTHTNGRVTLTRLYRSTSGGYKPFRNTLEVDGEQHALVPGFNEYVKIFGVEKKPETAEPVSVPEIEPLPEGAAVPAIVDDAYQTLMRSAQDHGIPVSLGRVGSRYAIGLISAKGVLHVYFSQRSKRWGFDPLEPLLMINANGEDLTWQAGNDIGTAMSALLGLGETQEAPAPPTIGRSRKTPGTATSVQVRKTTVIRN